MEVQVHDPSVSWVCLQDWDRSYRSLGLQGSVLFHGLPMKSFRTFSEVLCLFGGLRV